jgi:hypothetical protein
MLETAVWLVVTLYSPSDPDGLVIYHQEFPVAADAPELAGDNCLAVAAPYMRKALHVNRGNWRLEPACSVQHEEAEPAKGRE